VKVRFWLPEPIYKRLSKEKLKLGRILERAEIALPKYYLQYLSECTSLVQLRLAITSAIQGE